MAINRALVQFLAQGAELIGLDSSALSLPPADDHIRQLVAKYVEQCADRYTRGGKLRDCKDGREIEALPPERQLQVLYVAYARLVGPMRRGDVPNAWTTLMTLTGILLRSALPHTPEGLTAMLAGVVKPAKDGSFMLVPLQALLRAAARHVKKHGLTPGIEQALTALRAACEKRKTSKSAAHAVATIDEILGKEKPPPPPLTLPAGEAWADEVIKDMAGLLPTERAGWTNLLAYCRTATPSHPTKKWLAAAAELVTKVGPSFPRLAAKWLPLIDRPRTKPLRGDHGDWSPDPNLLISDESAQILKGLAWCCATTDDAGVASGLADCAVASFKKIRWKGPRCPKLGSACMDALALMPSAEAAAQLSRLASVVKQPTGKKTVTKALSNLATRTHQTPDDLEELAVPTYDMATPGVVARKLGTYTARLDFTSPSDLVTTYVAPGGKVQKSCPAEVKRDHAADLKAFQKLAKDVEKMLAAQRVRVERLLMSDRSWSIDDWQKRYLHHPLLAPLVRRLIWSFTDGKQTVTAMPDGDRLVGHDAKPVDPSSAARVRLWHPVGATVELVQAWRTSLIQREVTQPFKQAHREIYILTDAELRTRTYSNRFAAHIIRQQQFRALCEQRGWKAGLVGTWDSGSDPTPTLDLPRHNLRAQFWIDVAHEGNLTDMGVVQYLSTDQVRFYRPGATQPLDLTDVPALVFSEVMRDVDLFVGVCSAGNDPNWHDTGRDGAFGDYWHSFSFGDLSASAKTRREVLSSLLPRLKIADRCTLVEKFLVVRGKLRTYKIHLGSSNILMEPNDQYLCIVPDRRTSSEKGEVLLPFEGDPTLSVILSKAFLLADDAKIKDPTIVRQIHID
jgi:hypothetical protein